MTSIKNEWSPYSMKDFEKGLVLAGLITPNSISELHERNELEKYEKENGIKKSKLYFKRIVLAAEVAKQLYKEPTLGHVKFQKLVYLCENAANMNLNAGYSKQAAGPFDNKFMHTIDSELKKNKWFNVEKKVENNFTRFKYTPLENLENYKQYYISYFKDSDSSIQNIIELFRNKKTDYTEIAATIYACLIELDQKKQDINTDSLLELFYNWSDKKKRFGESEIVSIWKWMIEKKIVPV